MITHSDRHQNANGTANGRRRPAGTKASSPRINSRRCRKSRSGPLISTGRTSRGCRKKTEKKRKRKGSGNGSGSGKRKRKRKRKRKGKRKASLSTLIILTQRAAAAKATFLIHVRHLLTSQKQTYANHPDQSHRRHRRPGAKCGVDVLSIARQWRSCFASLSCSSCCLLVDITHARATTARPRPRR